MKKQTQHRLWDQLRGHFDELSKGSANTFVSEGELGSRIKESLTQEKGVSK